MPEKIYLPYILTRASSPFSISFANSYSPDSIGREDMIGYAITHVLKYNLFGQVLSGTGVCGEYAPKDKNRIAANLCTRWYQ